MIYSPKRELKRFLDEDVGKGDITSKLLQKKSIVARIITREETIVAGTMYAKEIFALKKCRTKIYKKDGKKHSMVLTRDVIQYKKQENDEMRSYFVYKLDTGTLVNRLKKKKQPESGQILATFQPDFGRIPAGIWPESSQAVRHRNPKTTSYTNLESGNRVTGTRELLLIPTPNPYQPSLYLW